MDGDAGDIEVVVKLGDSNFPVSSGSGGQFGANSSTAGVYAAAVKLREAVVGGMTGLFGLSIDADGAAVIGKVGARAKHSRCVRSQYGDADGRVLIDGINDPAQGFGHFAIDGIPAGRPVQQHGRNAAVDGEENVLSDAVWG